MKIKPLRIIELAAREAERARHVQHRFGAVLYRGSSILATAHNFNHIHSEHAVLNQAWRSDVRGSTMCVIRILKSGQAGMAMPCDVCLKRMVQAGLKRVIYSNQEGDLDFIKLTGLVLDNEHVEYPYLRHHRGHLSHDRYRWGKDINT